MGCFMDWLRLHRRRLLHLTLGVWLPAMAVAAFQGCLAQADHHSNAALPVFSSQPLAAGRVQHAGGCLEYCADSAQGLIPTTQILSLELAGMAMPLLSPALILLAPTGEIIFAALAVWRQTSGPPARIRFARFNE
jgi:hypothetical protein